MTRFTDKAIAQECDPNRGEVRGTIGGGKQVRGFSPLRRGFTLIELIVVMSIIAILMALLLCAVQATRETARKVACSNNIKNQVLAVHEFHLARRYFPPGRDVTPAGEYSWCFQILPYLEQPALHDQFDISKPWSDPNGNWTAAQKPLAVFRCPTSQFDFPGDSDYGGVSGSLMSGTSTTFDTQNGVMIEVGVTRTGPLSIAGIRDGVSQTIIVAECTDREPSEGGMWVTGHNCFSHDNGPINSEPSSEIFSYHPRGAFVGFADGAVRFLPQETPQKIVGSFCTRSGAEIVGAY